MQREIRNRCSYQFSDYTWCCTSSEAAVGDGVCKLEAILKDSRISAGSGKIVVLGNLQRTTYVTNIMGGCEVVHEQYLPNRAIHIMGEIKLEALMLSVRYWRFTDW